jgi:hypothetical protein
MLAAFYGHNSCVKVLVDANADQSITMTTTNEILGSGPGTTALDLATMKSHTTSQGLLTIAVGSSGGAGGAGGACGSSGGSSGGSSFGPGEAEDHA